MLKNLFGISYIKYRAKLEIKIKKVFPSRGNHSPIRKNLYLISGPKVVDSPYLFSFKYRAVSRSHCKYTAKKIKTQKNYAHTLFFSLK